MRSFFLLFPLLFLACASSEGDGSDNGPPKNTAGTGGQAGAAGQAGQGGGGAGQPTAGNGSSGEAGAGGTAAGASGGSTAGAGGAAGAGGTAAGAGGNAGQGAGGAGAGAGGAGGSTGGAGAGGSNVGGDPFGGAGGGTEAKCETAVLVEVGPAQPFKSSADTATFSNYFGAYCDKVGASGRDTVHKLMPLADGTVTVRLETIGSSYDPVLSVTTGECTVFVTNKDGSCANYSGPGGAEELEVTVTKGSPFWVYVDGVKEADGAYLLSIQYSTGAGGAGGGSAGGAAGQGGAGGSGAQGGVGGSAGEGGVGGSAGEGGAGQGGVGGAGGGTAGSSGQGGSGGVVAEGQSCDAPVVVKVEAGKPLVVQGSTAAAANNFLGYCNALNDAKDQVYEVIAGGAGKLSAKLEPLDPALDVALYAYKDACDGILLGSDTNGGKGACSELLGPGVAETLSPLSVTAGSKTYVYVDTNGKNGTKGGAFQLTLTLE